LFAAVHIFCPNSPRQAGQPMDTITYRTAEIDSRADRFQRIAPDFPGVGKSATQIGAE